MRLKKGTALFRGQVEVLYSGNWWPVCSYGWDLRDANVICCQLGYNGAESSVDWQMITEQPSSWRDMWLDNVQCEGNETFIMECKHNGLGYCLLRRQASLVCSPEGTFMLLNFNGEQFNNLRPLEIKSSLTMY